MKKVALAAAIAMFAGASFAGTPVVVVEPPVEVVEDAPSSSSVGWMPVVAILLIGAAVALSD